MSLRYRLLLIFIMGLLPMVGMEVYNAYALHQARRAEIEQQAIHQARQTASDLDRLVQGIEGILTTLAEAPVVQRSDITECSAFLSRVLSRMGYLTSIATTDVSGTVVCSTNLPKQPVSIADRDYFQAALAAADAVVGEYVIGKVTQTPLLPVAIAMKDRSEANVGIVVATLDLGWLSRYLEQRGYAPGGSVTVADRKGTILARQPQPEKFVGQQIPAEFSYLLQRPEAGSLEVVSQDGTRRILGYVPLNNAPDGLYVSTGLSYTASFGWLSTAAWRQFAFTIVAIALTLVAGSFASSYFVRKPVEAILATARQWREGNTAARTYMKPGRGEIEEIGAELDHSIKELSRREETINVLMHELSHRAKNQITLILAMARQIGKRAPSVEAYQDALSQRLTALAASQDLLREPGQINMQKVLAAQFEVFSLEYDGRIEATGPFIEVEPETGRLLGMAFHELLTNAEKYGALSVDTGRINISWNTNQEEPATCTIIWQEQEGPLVQEPKTTGFGRLLIERIIPAQLNGTTSLTFGPEGVLWQLEFPLGATLMSNAPSVKVMAMHEKTSEVLRRS